MIRNVIVFCTVFLFFIGQNISAYVDPGQKEHEAMMQEQEKMKHEHIMRQPAKEVIVDGIRVSFWVETMMEHHQMMDKMNIPMAGMKMDPDSTHEISISLFDVNSKKPITNAKINLKIIRPDGSDQIKMAMWMKGMNHFGADFKMDQKGEYQVLTLFKVGDKKHKAGFYYHMGQPHQH
ncbi:MAG: hypothetical protein SV062_03600 [Thermodesulfobacteriota bacterium]|nr:hypothetical protein [Thermodesulfobacteriota bacterium]